METYRSHVCLSILAAVLNLVNSQGEPAFLKQPEDTQVIAGSTAFLDCQVHNNDAGAPIQWTRDGFVLAPGRDLAPYPRYTITGNEALGEHNLFIANAQLEDDAVFECQIGATANTPGKISTTAQLTVLLPPGQPMILGSVADTGIGRYHLDVTEGVAYNVTCHANHGKPAAQITWFIDGEEQHQLVTYEHVPGEEEKTEDAIGRLEITPTKEHHEQRVECRANNAALLSARYTRVVLKVLYRPDITMTVEPSRKVNAGGSVTFRCEGEANPNQITWKWRVGEEEVAGMTSDTYVMTQIGKDRNEEVVTCEATNAVGSSTHPHTLNVQFAPYFTVEPDHVAGEPGDDVILRCDVSGNPTPTISWKRAGTTRIVNRGDTYSITSAERGQFGTYTCTASSVDFPDVSRSVYLLRKGRPKITSDRKQSVRVGETAALKCEALSVPAPDQITWYKNGKPVEESKRFTFRDEETPHGRKSILEIQSSQDKDFGKYNCTVTNSYGPATVIIEFTEEEVISLTYILLGVFLSVAVIIVFFVTFYVLYRRRKTGSEYGSDSSENTLQKKDDKPEISQISSTQSSTDQWANSSVKYLNEQNKPIPNNYTPNNYEDPSTVASKQPDGYDYQDGHGNRAYAPYPGNPYGTFPGPVNHNNPRYAASDYGVPSNYSDIGTYGRSRTPQPYTTQPLYAGLDHGGPIRPPHAQPVYAQSDYGGATLPRMHPHSSVHRPHVNLDSRLATNV